MTQPKAEAHVAHAIDLATGRIFAKPIENRILRILGQQHRLKIGLEKAVNMRPYMPRLYGSVWVEEVLLSQVVARLVNNNVVPNTGPAALSSSLEMDAAAHIPSVLELISDGSIDATTPIENIRYSLPDPEAIKIRSSKELSILQKLLLRLKGFKKISTSEPEEVLVPICTLYPPYNGSAELKYSSTKGSKLNATLSISFVKFGGGYSYSFKKVRSFSANNNTPQTLFMKVLYSVEKYGKGNKEESQPRFDPPIEPEIVVENAPLLRPPPSRNTGWSNLEPWDLTNSDAPESGIGIEIEKKAHWKIGPNIKSKFLNAELSYQMDNANQFNLSYSFTPRHRHILWYRKDEKPLTYVCT